MSGTGKCTSCGSTRVIPDVTIVDRAHSNMRKSLSIEIDRKPGALFCKGTEKAPLLATICGDCGHVDLRVKDPGKLYEVWRKRGK